MTCWSWHPTDSGCRYRAAVGDFALNDIIPRGASPPLNCKHSQRCGISVPQQLVDTSPGWSTARVRAHSKRRLQQTAADRSRLEQTGAGCRLHCWRLRGLELLGACISSQEPKGPRPALSPHGASKAPVHFQGCSSLLCSARASVHLQLCPQRGDCPLVCSLAVDADRILF